MPRFINETKIHWIREVPFNSGRGWYIDITFSLKKDDYYHDRAIRLSKDYLPLDTYVFKTEDYQQYLEEEEKYDYVIDNLLEAINNRTTPYAKLFDKRLKSADYVINSRDAILDYNPKTNVFTFREAVTKTPTTEGCLLELYQLMAGIVSEHYISPVESYILHAIKTLDKYWD